LRHFPPFFALLFHVTLDDFQLALGCQLFSFNMMMNGPKRKLIYAWKRKNYFFFEISSFYIKFLRHGWIMRGKSSGWWEEMNEIFCAYAVENLLNFIRFPLEMVFYYSILGKSNLFIFITITIDFPIFQLTIKQAIKLE